MLIEHRKHLKTLAMIQHPLVVEQETKGTILGGHTDQALAEMTCVGNGGICDEEGIRAPSAVVGQPKVVMNTLVVIQINVHIIDIRKLDRLGEPKGSD